MAAAGGSGYKSTDQLEAARRQVDEVQNIMRSNVEKVLERDGKLSSLENRAEHLQVFICELRLFAIQMWPDSNKN
jgi:hypothetical protein